MKYRVRDSNPQGLYANSLEDYYASNYVLTLFNTFNPYKISNRKYKTYLLPPFHNAKLYIIFELTK